MKRLYLGIGNDWRGDDRLAWVIIDTLKKDFSERADFEKSRADAMQLLELWKGYEDVILIDAVHSGQKAGTLLELNLLTDTVPSFLNPSSSHELGIAEAIELGRSLKRLPSQLRFYGIEIGQVTHGQELSQEVERSCQQLIEKFSQSFTPV